MYIVIAIIIFGILIAVHELGHFTAAKLSKVRVDEFAIGMGPKLLKKQGKETLYTLRALPIGGFCSMGEDAASEEPRAFTNQRAWKRTVILAAGSAMNFLLGFLIILLIAPAMNPGGYQTAQITGFMDGCPYQGAQALQMGDVFYKIDGERIYNRQDLNLFLSRNTSGVFDLVLLRDGKQVTLNDFSMTPHSLTDNEGNTGQYYGFYFTGFDSGFFAAIRFSWYQAIDYVRQVRLGLVDLFTGAVGINGMAGMVGMVDFMNQVGEQSPTVGIAMLNILSFGALIAINLAVMNLLPIPALDGGRILFLWITWVIERITKRKLDPKYEGYIHFAVLVLLLGFIAFVTFNDIMRIIRR